MARLQQQSKLTLHGPAGWPVPLAAPAQPGSDPHSHVGRVRMACSRHVHAPLLLTTEYKTSRIDDVAMAYISSACECWPSQLALVQGCHKACKQKCLVQLLLAEWSHAQPIDHTHQLHLCPPALAGAQRSRPAALCCCRPYLMRFWGCHRCGWPRPQAVRPPLPPHYSQSCPC